MAMNDGSIATGRGVGSLPRPGAAVRFWGVAYALLVMLVGTNLASALYGRYEVDFGFSPVVLTAIFAAYVAALIPALLLGGPLSDAIGRRSVLLPAIGVAAAAALLFALADGVAMLFCARVLQGIAVGTASGALTAALSELEPRGDGRRAALTATVASMGGLGLGPLLGGALAQYGPDPLRSPFLLEIALLVPAAPALAALPSSARRPWRPRRPELPAAMRSAFALTASLSFLAFAVIGVCLALVPSYVAELTGDDNLMLGGGAVALMLAFSVAAQLLGHGRPAAALESAGVPLLAAGLALLILAGAADSLPLLLAAIAVAGAGQGLTFLAGLAAVNDAAPPERRGEVVSTFYVVVYLGVGLPVVGVGLLADSVGLLAAVRWFAALIAALCLVAMAVRRRYVSGPR
ncbi:MAG TPA: MFS transporter [Solirubrobacterales bacterium]|nr:MFS transporter [Solirubrobacterales bacterium]